MRRVAKLAAGLLSLLILLPPLVAFCVLAVSAPDPPETVLPDPNGYQDLVAAAKVFELAGVDNLDMALDTATRQQLQAFVASCGHAFNTARVGLARECRVPIGYSVAEDWDTHFELDSLLGLARAFRAEGKLAELEGRPADAVESYLDMIRLGRVGTRGGVLVNDWVVGRTFEAMGLHELTELRESLAPEECSDLMDALQTLDANWEPLDDVLARQQLWVWIVLDWKWQLMHKLRTINASQQEPDPYLQWIGKDLQARFRLLICGLALRSYCVENGEPPERLADLVPDYLPEVPLDPFSGKPLVYRREATGHVLYSVGLDGQDDGGESLDYDYYYYSGPYMPADAPPYSGTDILLDGPPEGEEEEE